MEPSGSPLMTVAAKAADTLVRLRRLEAMRKLTSDTFLRDAMQSASLDEAGLDRIKAAFEASKSPTLAAVVRRLARFFSERTCPRFPLKDKFEKILRHCGQDGFDAALTDAGLSTHEVGVLAVIAAVDRFPERFGEIENWSQHEAAIADARAELDRLEAKMRSIYTATDLLIDRPPLPPLPDLIKVNPNDRAAMDAYHREQFDRQRALRNLQPGPWLKLHPSISLSDPHWTRQLVEALLSGPSSEEVLAKVEKDEPVAEPKHDGRRKRKPDDPIRPRPLTREASA